MTSDVIKNIIVGKQRDIPKIALQKRDVTLGSMSNYVLVGLRRAGKSYMLYQDIQQRIAEGTNRAEDILYVNFEDERLIGMTAAELNGIMEAYEELYGVDRRPLVYLDEVQNVAGWEHFARRLADEGYRIVITGSNARMLSREMASTLGGRFIPRQVHPFSFMEYVEWEGITLTDNWLYDQHQRIQIARLFMDYLRYGGIAEGFRQTDRREYLNSLYQKILMGDIVERNGVRNPRVFRLMARKLAESVMQPMSLSRLQHIVKATGESISLSILKDYLDYMGEAYLTMEIPNMTSPLTERETLRKRYFADNGILNLFPGAGDAKLLENYVAVSLHNSTVSLDGEPSVFYYNKGLEVDFCVPSHRLAIQVALSLSDPLTLERESRALARFVRAYPDYAPLIITLGERRSLTLDGVEIPIVPAWEWALGRKKHSFQ